jgi:hypothetical protein
MARGVGGQHLCHMIQASITYRSRSGSCCKLLSLGSRYGVTADVAHEVVLAALTACQKPVLLDGTGRLHRFPRGRITRVLVWEADLPPLRLDDTV